MRIPSPHSRSHMPGLPDKLAPKARSFQSGPSRGGSPVFHAQIRLPGRGWTEAVRERRRSDLKGGRDVDRAMQYLYIFYIPLGGCSARHVFQYRSEDGQDLGGAQTAFGSFVQGGSHTQGGGSAECRERRGTGRRLRRDQEPPRRGNARDRQVTGNDSSSI